MSGDDEDFLFYGTPIEREEEISSRRKKAVAEASGQLRTLPPWKQEVTDEEGRRRFHGAFMGGFSAGYYNTVGSKAGWTPQSFTSSRKNRAEINQQSIYNFLDEDEKAELEGRSLGTSMQFDTFGFTAAELARKQAEKEQKQRPSTIPGPIPDDLIIPATESIGVKLLLRMGWRHGRSIKNSGKSSQCDARREARRAFLAFSSHNEGLQLPGRVDEDDSGSAPGMPVDKDDQFSNSTPVYVLNPKQDLYGLGYDPFKQAPEFREKKRLRYSGKLEMDLQRPISMKRKTAGFGIGALEDLDAEDEDIYDSVYDFEDTYVREIEEPSRSLNADNSKIADTKKLKILDKNADVLPGFKVSSDSDGQLERFEPPEIPKDFLPHHKFPAALGPDDRIAKISPPEVPPPEDNNLKVLIEGMATLVARSGKLFEDLSREKNQLNPLFAFLCGGNGSDFYARKLWEQHQKLAERSKLGEWKLFKEAEKLTAESRGKILGEKALDRRLNDSSSIVASAGSVTVQFKLSDTFTQPSSLNEERQSRKPFSDDPAKQIRFEQFLKEKYEGGLRTKDFGGSSKLSEAARARERLEFEDAAEAMKKGKSGKESQATSQLLSDLSATAGLQFTTGGVQGIKTDKIQRDEELITKSNYPKREEFQWRPAPILCKRFDLVDPFIGKPPPAPHMRSKMDTLVVMPDFIETVTAEEHVAAKPALSLVPQDSNETRNRETSEMEVENEVEVGNVERPVDLYKAIFSDDSDDEVEDTMTNKLEDTKKIFEAASTSLNHLIAGDFLESLGKELGLEVPPDLPQPVAKAGTKPVEQKTVNALKQNGDLDFPSTEKIEMPNAIKSLAGPNVNENKDRDGRFLGDMSKESRFEDIYREDRTLDTLKSRRLSRGSSSSSSEDGKSRKHLRGSQRHRNSTSRTPDTDTSDVSREYRDRYHSSSKRKSKGSTRDKSGSRKRAKEHKHRRSDSRGRYHRSSRKEFDDDRRKKHKYSD